MPIHIYVEHLLHIRTLSIQASLQSDTNKETKPIIFAEGATLTLMHESETAGVTLPVNISPNKRSKIGATIPATPTKEITFRIQLEEKDGHSFANYGSNVNTDPGNVVPWGASKLTESSEICCSSCSAILLGRSTVQAWKDLPSEGWAEMMEFWHCHKPDHPDGPHAHGADGEVKKGYAAGSKLALEPGIGLVDTLDILISSEDCDNIKVGLSFVSHFMSILKD